MIPNPRRKPTSDTMRAAVRELIVGMGDDPKREGLAGTPDRVVRAFMEMTDGYRQDPSKLLSTTFAEQHDSMVVVRNIPFWSLCEHHLMPFHGTATVGYLPNGRVVGLSKIPRLVHCFAKRFQIQERLTEEIAKALQKHIRPRGVGVIIGATHLCMHARGIKSAGEYTTSCLLGTLRDDANTRREFLALR